MKSITIAMAQMNPTIADIVGNTQIIIDFLEKARENDVDVIAFPEMAIIGYPAQDLLFRPEIIESNLKALEYIAPHTKGFKCVAVGYCEPAIEKEKWRIDRQHLYNAYAVFSDGKIIGKGQKICLPGYGVFDDYRYFIPGTGTKIYQISDVKIGIEICEDLWYQNRDDDHPIYPFRPTRKLADDGADFILVLNASPYYAGKEKVKEELVQNQSKDNNIPIFYINMWGGNDKIIFDGNSFACDCKGEIIVKGDSFKDDLVIYNLDLETKQGVPLTLESFNEAKNIYNALILGKRDYHKKCGLKKSVVGVSGGIDSATVLALDVAALGKENVLAILSPSRFSSEETLRDSIKLCENFEIEYKIVPIEYKSDSGDWVGVIPEKTKRYIQYFGLPKNEVVFENQQAIDRMSILRSIANEENRLISGTGNKSELATGYATVCGDLQADILVIGDLYKGQVYDVANYINSLYKKEMIPETIITRTPSAELAEDQVDPFDYSRLDYLVKLKVEEYLSDEELLKHSPPESNPFTEDEVRHYSKLIDLNEHKRFKSGYILKVSSVAFGEDRRINTAKKITLF